MAPAVIDELEGVEVEHQDRERRAFGCLRRLEELALERAVVSWPGQGVVLGPHRDRTVSFGILERERCLAGIVALRCSSC